MEYKIGDMVPKTGRYQCTQCGNVQIFERRDEFTDCDACLAGGTHIADEAMGWTLVEESPTMD